MSRPASRGFDARHRWMLRLYSLVMALAVICLLRPHRWLRRLAGREDRLALQQLLGEPDREPPMRPDLVIHAVSAGEMVAAGAIIRQLEPLRLDLRLLLTTGTAAGLEIGRILQRELPCIGDLSLLPWDRAGAMGLWLNRLSPRALVVVETELWPNLFDTCRRLGIALAVVNGRLYPGDVWKYRLIRGFMAQVLACPQWVGVQDETERQRFLSVGADPRLLTVLGNAKFASPPPPDLAPHRFRGADDRPARLIVAGSTHAPEEAWLLDVLPDVIDAFPGTRLVLAPRHPQRAAGLARIATRRGWRCCRLSRDAWRNAAWDVLILDRMGQLAPFYAGAEVVVMGGSLANCGGHNFLEPAWFARPIVVGPHLGHFENVAKRFIEQGALCQVRNRAGLAARLTTLLGDPGLAMDIGRKARECAEREGERAGGYGQAVADLLNAGPMTHRRPQD